jgi:hypothetical protein
MRSSKGNEVLNQFIISYNNIRIFQSYRSLIALYDNNKIIINEDYYKYSRTTSKYLSLFLDRTSKEIAKDIKENRILLYSNEEFNNYIEMGNK